MAHATSDDSVRTLAPAAASATPRAGISVESKIDLCRGIFAFLVVLAHSYEVMFGIYPRSLETLTPTAESLVHTTLGTGFYYVMGFFVISGYCIHLSVGRLQKSGTFLLNTYVVARLTRILPLYYIGLFTTVVVERLIVVYRPSCWQNGLNWPTLFSQLACIQNFYETYGSFAPSWSITNEVAYYLMYGALVAVAPKTRGRAPWTGFVVCVVLAGTMLALYRVGIGSRLAMNVGLLFGLGINWFLGVLIAVHREELVRLPSVRFVCAAWPLLLASAIGLWSSRRCPLEVVFMLSGFAFALMLLGFLVKAERRGPIREPAWVSSGARFLGLSSYPTYLFHGPVIMFVGAILFRREVISDWRGVWVVLFASGAVAGLVLGVLLEAPIMAWRSRLLGRLKSGARVQPGGSDEPRPSLAPGSVRTA